MKKTSISKARDILLTLGILYFIGLAGMKILYEGRTLKDDRSIITKVNKSLSITSLILFYDKVDGDKEVVIKDGLRGGWGLGDGGINGKRDGLVDKVVILKKNMGALFGAQPEITILTRKRDSLNYKEKFDEADSLFAKTKRSFSGYF